MKLRALLASLLALLASHHASHAMAADFPAVLDWSGRVQLTLPVAGVLEQVLVQAGQTVKKDALLASLNPALFKAGVAEARADLDRLTLEEADARRDLDRVKELYARTVAPTSELDAAALRHARAQAGLGATQARLEKARRLLAESELRAPFDAIILARLAEPGQVISIPCQPAGVVSIARADEWLVRAPLDAAQASRLNLGEKVEVTLGAQAVAASIRALTALAEGRYQLEAVIPRGPGLHVGQAAGIRTR